MKRYVKKIVVLYFLIKKNFFNIETGKDIKLYSNGISGQEDYKDEYHEAFSGVTRWQTL